MVVVAEEDLINHGRATSKNGQASRCRHLCTSQMTEVDGQSSQRMHLLQYPQRRLGVTGISSLVVSVVSRLYAMICWCTGSGCP